MLANALVSSKLDYCNSLLSSVTGKDLHRLQLLQNTLCRIVCRLPWRSHVSSHLRSLHWLPIRYRIDFKIGVLVFKTLHLGFPKYLLDYLASYTCNANTRRSNPANKLLKTVDFQRNVHSSFNQLKKSFAYSAPRLWNALPLDLRLLESLHGFRRHLKKHLFSLAYPP